MRPDFNKMELIPAIVQDYQTKEVLFKKQTKVMA